MRFTALGLAFLCGGAVMFAINRSPVKANVRQATNVDPPSSEPDSKPVRLAALEKFEIENPSVEPATLETTVASVEQPLNDQLCIAGITEPAPGHYAKLPLATNQAVAFVDVKPGDRVKKGWQVFSHWESPERLAAVKTDLEKTRKMHEVATSRWRAASQTLERLEKLNANVTAQELQDARNNTAIRQGEMEAAELSVRAAESHLAAMEFEFNQAFVTSPLNGIVASVEIHPGDRRQAGGSFRGVTVIDPTVLNCRCFIDQKQLAVLQKMRDGPATHLISDAKPLGPSIATAEPDSITNANEAAATTKELYATVRCESREWPAKITSIGIIANESTGLVPVILEVDNSDEQLTCGVRVEVSFASNALNDY